MKKGLFFLYFALAFIVSMLIIGSLAFFVVKISNSSSQNENSSENALNITENNSKQENLHTILLFTLESNDKTLPITFFYVDFNLENNSISLKVIENDITVCYNNKNYQLEKLYKIKGVYAVKNSLEEYLSCDFSRFVKLDSDSFDNLIKILGVTDITLSQNIKKHFEYLDETVCTGKDIEKIITFENYDGKEKERCENAENLLNEIVKSSDRERILQSIDFYFKSFVNSVKTDINAIDYINFKEDVVSFLSNTIRKE